MVVETVAVMGAEITALKIEETGETLSALTAMSVVIFLETALIKARTHMTTEEGQEGVVTILMILLIREEIGEGMTIEIEEGVREVEATLMILLIGEGIGVETLIVGKTIEEIGIGETVEEMIEMAIGIVTGTGIGEIGEETTEITEMAGTIEITETIGITEIVGIIETEMRISLRKILKT